MRCFSVTRLLRVIALFLSCWASLSAQSQTVSSQNPFESVEGLLAEVYKAVSFEAGQPQPDWEKVRSMFIENAIVVLRVRRDSMAIFSVQGFIDEFVKFIEHSPAKQNGFDERIVRLKPTIIGDIAQAFVLYEAKIPGTLQQPQQGIDSWELVKRNGRWWIVAATNEVVTKSLLIPKELKE